MRGFMRLMCVVAGVAGLAVSVRADDGQIVVTEKVAAAVKDGALSIAASNDNFTDPKEGEGKKLKVEFTVDGVADKKVVNENDTLEIKAEGKKLVVTKAVYGVMDDAVTLGADVTATVAAAVQNNRLSISADNDTLKGDPLPGVTKQLKVDYTVGGAAKTATVNEGETLSLPASGDGEGALKITKAQYGTF